MPLPAPAMKVTRARKKWKAYPDTQAAAVVLIEAGWHLYEHTSGHVSAWCPHGHPESGKPVRLNGTPRKDGSHARRVRRESRYCPGSHHLLDSR